MLQAVLAGRPWVLHVDTALTHNAHLSIVADHEQHFMETIFTYDSGLFHQDPKSPISVSCLSRATYCPSVRCSGLTGGGSTSQLKGLNETNVLVPDTTAFVPLIFQTPGQLLFVGSILQLQCFLTQQFLTTCFMDRLTYQLLHESDFLVHMGAVGTYFPKLKFILEQLIFALVECWF